MRGTVLAEFAGTRTEAETFARSVGLNYAQSKGLSPNGLPFVSLPYRSHAELSRALAKFDEYGWDRDSVTITRLDRVSKCERKGRDP